MATSAVCDFLTIVIPVYNRADKLRACLDSIACQTVLPGHVIVVDDGSTDGSSEVARVHSLSPEVLVSPHAGAAGARNAGLASVTTEWTMFFDSDDTMSPAHVEHAVGAPLEAADIVGWDVTCHMENGATRRLPFETDDIGWHNIMHGTFATQRYMARTALFRSAGGWNSEMLMWDDIELGARLLALGPCIVKVEEDEPTVWQNAGAESITGPSWSSRIGLYDAPLEAMAATLGEDHAGWIALKRAILAADIAREVPEAGREMYCRIARRPLAVRLAYHYRRMGGRGAARLLRPFFPPRPGASDRHKS